MLLLWMKLCFIGCPSFAAMLLPMLHCTQGDEKNQRQGPSQTENKTAKASQLAVSCDRASARPLKRRGPRSSGPSARQQKSGEFVTARICHGAHLRPD